MASYNKFNYNFRPSKSVERKIFIELMMCIYGVSEVKNCSYIGFGSIFFTDFKLVHKELGIEKMINIEGEIEDEKRFTFNSPFNCITLKWGMSYDVLPTLDWSDKKIVWLDYDKNLQQYMFDDIDHVFSNLETESFYMMSCNSLLSRYYDRAKNEFKVIDFKSDFQGLYPFNITPEMMENKNSPFLIRDMVCNRINHNLKQLNAIRTDSEKLEFVQLIFIIYKDGAPMVSVGGYLTKRSKAKAFKKSDIFKLQYVRSEKMNPLNIETPLLTNQEIDLLNNYLPSTKTRFIKRKLLGFIPKEEKEKYFGSYRYYPSYVEVKDS